MSPMQRVYPCSRIVALTLILILLTEYVAGSSMVLWVDAAAPAECSDEEVRCESADCPCDSLEDAVDHATQNAFRDTEVRDLPCVCFVCVCVNLLGVC